LSVILSGARDGGANGKTAAVVGKNVPPRPGLAPADDLPAEYWQALLDDPRADGADPGRDAPGRALRLDQIAKHLLRVGCRRCGRTVEIQKVDAVRI
jgi:hypothetical protein